MRKSILLVVSILIFVALNAQITDKEFAALKAMYEQMGGKNWKNAKGWDFTKSPNTVTTFNKGDSTGWYGITVKRGRVANIKLSNNNITGTIPDEFYNLDGLQILNLSKNNITGEISPKISLLIQLTYLDLGSNILSGSIPAEIANIGSASRVKASDNAQFVIFLSRNQLSGQIPTSLLNMILWSKPNAGIKIDFSSNKLTGNVPEGLDKITNLILLRLDKNTFTGNVPQVDKTK